MRLKRKQARDPHTDSQPVKHLPRGVEPYQNAAFSKSEQRNLTEPYSFHSPC